MEFEQMKRIWDSQNEEPLYAINEATLQRRIQEKGSSISYWLSLNEWVLIGVTLLAGVVLLVDAILEGSARHQIASAIIVLPIPVYVYLMRQGRRQRELQFDDTMLGDLDKAVAQLEFRIRQLKGFMWWYWLPFGIGFAISLFYVNQWYLLVGLMILTFAGSRWEIQRELNKRLRPQREELLALRRLLLNG